MQLAYHTTKRIHFKNSVYPITACVGSRKQDKPANIYKKRQSESYVIHCRDEKVMRFSLETRRMISASAHPRSLVEQLESVTEHQTNREGLSLRIL